MIRQGTFREDLFYRLSVFPVEIPPLRERRQDIPPLVNYFVYKLCRRMRKQIRNIRKQTMDVLTNFPWKGNVRELANLIERQSSCRRENNWKCLSPNWKSLTLCSVAGPASTFHQAERNVIIDALQAASGQVSGRSGAAERLGPKRTTPQNYRSN
jgi:formate hydrogenlyase transcriptional activator